MWPDEEEGAGDEPGCDEDRENQQDAADHRPESIRGGYSLRR
jgi:hypothetical protein